MLHRAGIPPFLFAEKTLDYGLEGRFSTLLHQLPLDVVADIGGQHVNGAALAGLGDSFDALADVLHKGGGRLVVVGLGDGCEDGAFDWSQVSPELQETGCAGLCHRMMVGWNEVRECAIRLADASRSIPISLLHPTCQGAYICIMAYISIMSSILV